MHRQQRQKIVLDDPGPRNVAAEHVRLGPDFVIVVHVQDVLTGGQVRAHVAGRHGQPEFLIRSIRTLDRVAAIRRYRSGVSSVDPPSTRDDLELRPVCRNPGIAARGDGPAPDAAGCTLSRHSTRPLNQSREVPMPIKVSVVVPVYNPGAAIEPCIASLLAQSMPADDVELIFVDDASTDATPARLDALAAEHDRVTVAHRERGSGWSGTPRNDGVRVAAGEYIHFVDQDDALAPGALERLYDMASRNHSDVIFGKVASDFRAVPQLVFDHTIESCTLAEAPHLIESLTPHKMFRRQFLVNEDLRFPDGKRRLEDQPFVAKAYLRAKHISIYGDEVCYFYRRRLDGQHAARQKIDPNVYFHFLREVLEVVRSETEPGEFRNQLMWRWYRVELQRWLTAPVVFTQRRDFVDATWTQVRDILATYYTDGVDASYPMISNTQGQLIRSGRRDQSEEFALRVERLRPSARVRDVSWDTTGLRLALTALVGRDGMPLCLPFADGRFQLPPLLTDGIAGIAQVARTEDAIRREVRAEVVVRHRQSGAEWLLGELETVLRPMPAAGAGATDEHALVFEGDVLLDPLTAYGGQPLPRGLCDISVRLRAFGLVRKRRVDISATRCAPLRPLMLGSQELRVTPHATASGTVALAVGVSAPRRERRLTADITLSLAIRRHGSVHVRLRLPQIAEEPDQAASARIRADGATLDVPVVVDGAGNIEFSVDEPRLTGRTWAVAVRPGDSGPWQPTGTSLLVRPGAPVALIPAAARPAETVTRSRAVTSPLMRRAVHGVDVALGRLPEQMAGQVEHRLRRLARRVGLL